MIYCFVCDECGWEMEKVLSSPKILSHPVLNRPRCPQCRARMRRDLVAEHKGFKTTAGNWPMESDAAGLNPDQIPEAMAADRDLGVPTNYNPETGAAIFTSREHTAKYCKAHGLYDRNAGYGDATPKNNMRNRKERINRIRARKARVAQRS